MPFEIDARNSEVLLISDTHIPYSHPDYVIFLKAIKKKFKPDIVLHGGDELDFHSISFHPSDQELLSAGDELDRSIIEIQEGVHKLFKKMYLLESNHGSLVTRKMKAHGIPVRTLKPLHELYETPQWTWHSDILLNTNQGMTYICHGKTSAYGKLCKEMACNAIQFHFHGKSEITWHRSAMLSRYNMYCGCLVDEDSLAMAYGRNNLPKPILSVGRIDKNGMPHLIKMNLNSKGRWDGKL
jgi:hypothetical protein